MSYWERISKSDEWYTPKYIFDALQCEFDMDVAAPIDRTYCHVPAKEFIVEDSLTKDWKGFIWMNPPFGKRNGLEPWLRKISRHRHGVALVPDRTSAPWWQSAANESDALLFINHKVKFIRPNGTVGGSPSAGTVLLAYGQVAVNSLVTAEQNKLGILFKKFGNNGYRMRSEFGLFREPISNYNITACPFRREMRAYSMSPSIYFSPSDHISSKSRTHLGLSLSGKSFLGSDKGHMSIQNTQGDNAETRLIKDIGRKGNAVVMSAGNFKKNLDNENVYPGSINGANIYTISGFGNQDKFWFEPAPSIYGSNYGSPVDYSAPAVAIESTVIGNTYGKKTGTSMAAPHVAGILLVKRQLAVDGTVTGDRDINSDAIAHE